MAVKVIDASALAALLFGEPASEAVAARLRHTDLCAPGILEFEIANVCAKKLRLHPKQRDALWEAFRGYPDLHIDIATVDLGEAVALAERSGLSAYDASYLHLARMLDVELVTLDKKLGAVAA